MAKVSASPLFLLAVGLGLFLQPAASVRDDGEDLGLDTEEDEADNVEDPPVLPEPAKCAGSGIFVDWGSSGMKVLPVHSGEDPTETDKAAFKFGGLNPQSKKEDLEKALKDLESLLPASVRSKGTRFAVLATAGHRLVPDEAKKAWDEIKKWSIAHPGVLGNCNQDTDQDCQTIPGSQEAAWELAAALKEAKKKNVQVGKNYAFASSGGASLQVGFAGSDENIMKNCLDDLDKGTALGKTYDKERAAIKNVDGTKTLVLSFLSIANMKEDRYCETSKESETDRMCDYIAGGLDQARSAFSNWLRDTTIAKENPCISQHTTLKSNPAACQVLFRTDECAFDEHHGGISGLPAATNDFISNFKEVIGKKDRAHICQNFIRKFLDTDLMLRRWQGSNACWDLAGATEKVLLMTAFARPSQSGVDNADKWVTLEVAMNKSFAQKWVTETEAIAGKEGLHMTSVMLHTFLDKLHIPPDAELRAFDGSWTDAAMEERGLKRGWGKPGSCPK